MGHFLHFLVGFAVLLHVLFWGAGAALLAMPRRWNRFWPVLVPAMGFALQSAVVWVGAHTELEGTQRYAWWSEALPLALLALALRRKGWRAPWIDVSRFGLVWLLMAGTLLLLIAPLAFRSNGLTTISLGSCDAADYAAGARVLQEFASSDRAGFLGLAEVVRVHSADNFFAYWIRLNHFTPSALIAFNGSIVDCAPHELTSLMTFVILTGSLPAVFWIARAVVGYSGAVSLAIALLYGISPITWYAAAHVAPAQLLAAQAIAWLTWAGVALWRGRLAWRRGAEFAAVLGTGYWIVLGSYNFILLVALVPAACFAGGRAVWRKTWPRFARWGAMMLVPLGATGVLFFERVAGLVERFVLFRTHDFGWKIPVLTPEGWLGMVSGPRLEAWDFWGVRWLLVALVALPFAWAMWRAVRRGHPGAWVVASLTLPVLTGYWILEVRGVRAGTNASYDAYKLFAVFYPLLLPALCWWVTLRRSRRLHEWFGVVALGGFVCALNLVGTAFFGYHLARTPLMVDGAMRELRRIEAMPEVTSVNLLLPNMWERLWANAFLLRKPQYFATDTYEARWATPLRGEWNLESNLIAIDARGVDGHAALRHHRLVKNEAGASLQVTFGDGWHDEERLGADRWRWTRGNATLRVENRRSVAVEIRLIAELRSLAPQELEWVGPDDGAQRVAIGLERAQHTIGPLRIPPGTSELTLRVAPPVATAANDDRVLGVCLHRLTVVAID